MPDFLELDFCKSRGLRVARRFDVGDGITSAQLAGATSLGCNFPVSHRAASAPGFVLSRVNQRNGNKTVDLLESADERLFTNPGPTPYLSAAAERFLAGSPALPFPAALPSVNPVLSGSEGEVALAFQITGLGDFVGLRRTIVVPPGDLEYIDPGPLALHNTRHYMGCVASSEPLDSFRLSYATQSTVTGVRDVYVWQGRPGQGTQGTLNANNNWQHTVSVSVVGTPPVLTTYAPLVLTPEVAAFTGGFPGAVNTNGPAQLGRKFTYPFLGSDVNPNFGGSSAPEFSLSGTRPTLTVFRQGGFDAEFGGFSIFTVNGQPVSFTDVGLPEDQYASPSGRAFNFTAAGATSLYDSGLFGDPAGASQGMLYGPANKAGSLNIPIAATSLTFVIRSVDTAVGQPSLTFTINIPKSVNQMAWFEAIVTVDSRHIGVLS